RIDFDGVEKPGQVGCSVKASGLLARVDDALPVGIRPPGRADPNARGEWLPFHICLLFASKFTTLPRRCQHKSLIHSSPVPTRFALRGPVAAMSPIAGVRWTPSESRDRTSSSLCRREGGDAATARRRRYRKLAACKGRSPMVVCRGKGRPRRNGHHALRSLRQVRGFGGGL